MRIRGKAEVSSGAGTWGPVEGNSGSVSQGRALKTVSGPGARELELADLPLSGRRGRGSSGGELGGCLGFQCFLLPVPGAPCCRYLQARQVTAAREQLSHREV